MRSDAGVIDVSVTGVVRAPYFSAKSFHQTTLEEWLETERHHYAPWADFQTDNGTIIPTMDTTSDPGGKLLFTFRRSVSVSGDTP